MSSYSCVKGDTFSAFIKCYSELFPDCFKIKTMPVRMVFITHRRVITLLQAELSAATPLRFHEIDCLCP